MPNSPSDSLRLRRFFLTHEITTIRRIRDMMTTNAIPPIITKNNGVRIPVPKPDSLEFADAVKK